MGKRSRDASFSPSPSGDEAGSDVTDPIPISENLRMTKVTAYDTPVMANDKCAMWCSLPPHSASVGFASVEEFEVHYAKEHCNRCVECRKNLPSDHLLSLHLDENHNPVREALAAKGEKTYACFVPDCDKKCSTPQKRRMHMIDKHNFPKVYNFRVVDNGIDDAHTLLHEGRRRKLSINNDQSASLRWRGTSISNSADPGQSIANAGGPSIAQQSAIATESSVVSAELCGTETSRLESSTEPGSMSDLESSFAALQFVPRSVMSKREKRHV